MKERGAKRQGNKKKGDAERVGIKNDSEDS